MNDKQMVCELNVWMGINGIVHMYFIDLTNRFDGFHVHKNYTHAVIVKCECCLIKWVTPGATVNAKYVGIIQNVIQILHIVWSLR